MANPIYAQLCQNVISTANFLETNQSEIEEAAEFFYLAEQGDIYSQPFNPIRDTVFCGNQGLYDGWGKANLLVARVLILVSSTVNALGVTTINREVAVEVTKEVTKDLVLGGLSDYVVSSGVDIDQRVPEISGGESGSKTMNNAIPNVESAQINPKKLTEYALNPEHPVGGNKARVFESALGYNKSNAGDLMRQILDKLPSSKAVLGTRNRFGQRYTVDIPITGPNGRTVNVRTAWIIKTGSVIPELATLLVKN